MRLFQTNFIIRFLLFLLADSLAGQETSAMFDYLSTDNGLAQNHVFHVTQDQDGFMWFSTMGGLSKYDGFSFTNYYHKEGDSTTLSSSYINAFYQDSKGQCWVATQKGFNAWDRRTGTAHRFYNDPLNHKSLGHNQIRALIEDKKGFIWIAHQKGLDKFDPKTNEFHHYFNKEYSLARHSGALAINRKGEIWVLGVKGIFKVDHEKDSLLFLKELPVCKNYPPHEGRDLMIDSEDRIWMGYKEGLAHYIPETNQYEVFNDEPFGYGVMKILEYAPGTLAIATGRGGLVLWEIDSERILAHYKHSPIDEFSIRGPSIYTMYIDQVKNIWLGLFYGISLTNLETERFTFIRHGTGFANYANFILRVYKDPRGGIWSNTMAGLYYQQNGKSPGVEFMQPPLFPQGYKSISGITADKQGRVYMAFREVALFQYDYQTNLLSQLDDGKKIDMSNVHSLFSDNAEEKYLWICTSQGLCRWDKENKDTLYYRPPELNAALSSNVINRIAQDSTGDLYFINSGKICRLQRNSYRLDTLPCTQRIVGNIEGLDIAMNLLWIGSSEGVFSYDLKTKECREIKTKNGVQMGSAGLLTDENGIAWSIASNTVTRISGDSVFQFRSPTDFVYGIGSKSSEGELLFGGEKGYILINPNAFYTDTIHPKIIFCGIDVANKKKVLPVEAEYITDIQLQYTDKVFTLHYAPLHFNHRNGITYKYQLVGFDNEWIEAGTYRSVTYTNLPHGKYIFKAVAITEDQLTSMKPLHVVITILPPFYKTIYFYTLMALLSGGLFYFVYSLRRKALHLSKQKELAEQQTAYKSMFLANMSHEIRTPMNAIMGLNTLLLNTPLTVKQTEYAKAISTSCDNLLWIVNDILDQSKIESGSYAILTKPFDLNAILHQLEVLFHHLAAQKGITLSFTRNGDIPSSLLGDSVRLIQILSNLLNNAIKFTDKGLIHLDTTTQIQDEKNVLCTFIVTDTGIGIPSDQVTAIFDSFQQVNEKIFAGNQGTGLGLTIVKHLVDKMEGHIRLQSTHGKGSEFAVTLPFQINESVQVDLVPESSIKQLKKGLRILLVEDVPINQLVASELIKKWMIDPMIEFAENGAVALDKVQQSRFDLVLMDVKMPVMDGLEATRRIRNLEDPYFKTLPIAGLTANVVPQQIEECHLAGMNTFISKPIQQEDFLQKITNLFTS